MLASDAKQSLMFLAAEMSLGAPQLLISPLIGEVREQSRSNVALMEKHRHCDHLVPRGTEQLEKLLKYL